MGKGPFLFYNLSNMTYLNKNLEQFRKDLEGLIKYDTVLYSKEDYPTQGMKDSLSYMEELGKREGMKYYTDPKGYYGYLEIGEGEEMLGIVGHIDVVSPGSIEDWTNDPFTLTIDGDKWIARGTQDMKGPVMLMFYLMKQILEEDIELNKRVRLIYPTDEESYWRGIEKYNELEEAPTFGFTPDSRFPVTFLERESIGIRVTGPSFNKGKIKGGVSINAVPSEATFINKEGNTLVKEGKAAHAMDPTKGINAIQKLINSLDIDHPMINFIKDKVKYEVNGETLFGKLITDEYSTQTFNIGMIEMNEKGSMFTIDMRIPITDNADNLETIIKSEAENYGLTLKRIKHHDKLLVEKDSKLVATLTNAYNLVTGTKLEPVAIGGGTYARAVANTVAFGTLMPEELDTMHQVDESMNIEKVKQAYQIFEIAIKELIK